MSQRYFGRPLAREEPPDPLYAAGWLLAGILGVLVAGLIAADALDALTTKALVAALAVPVVTAVAVGVWEGSTLVRELRGAEPAASVAPPGPEEPAVRHDAADVAGLALLGGALVAVIALIGWPALAIGLSTVGVGRELGRGLAGRFVRRRERRLGRRYYRTVGEPEKVVWLTASGLD